jgi:[ribosomal protein S5]-alanine N-acetyltransferase
MFRLLQCDRDGRPTGELDPMPEALVQACQQSAELYRRIGYQPPWVSYVAADGNAGVGGGAFVGAPRDGIVEIAYFTLAEFMGRGYATLTARCLVSLARRAMPQIVLKAFTLPQVNASTKILERLGFERTGLAHDDDVGEASGMEKLCQRRIIRMNSGDRFVSI